MYVDSLVFRRVNFVSLCKFIIKHADVFYLHLNTTAVY